MAETSERIKLTPEEFEKYKRQIINLNKIDNDIISYSIVLLRENGVDLVQFFSQMIEDSSYTEEEIIKEINEDVGYDITQTTSEQILSTIPEVYREYFSKVAEHISQFQTFDELENFFDNFSLTTKINEQREKDKSAICDEISTYDLSLIPSEMYNDFEELDRINLKYTGAKLDFENFNPNVYVKGSIKGCELISFTSWKWKKVMVLILILKIMF